MLLRTSVSFLLCAVLCFAADVKGKWNLTATAASGREYKLSLDVRESDGKLAASIASDEGSMELEAVALEGNDFSFKIPMGDGYRIKLAVSENSMKGNFTGADGNTGPVVAVRPGAAASANAPAVAGKWKLTGVLPDGTEIRADLEFKNEAGKLSGSINVPQQGLLPLQDVKLDGDQLNFKVTAEPGVYLLRLTVTANSMKGNYQAPDGKGEITLVRQ